MKVYLYVLNTLADWEIGFVTAELNSGRYLDKSKETISIIKIGNTRETITTMGGIRIVPEFDIDEIEFREGDLLILPGADTWMNDENKKVLDIVANIIEKKERVIIAAICGATIALAKNGLLNNRNHTSNNKDYLKMVCPEYTGSDYYIEKPAVADGNLITASGLAPLEFTYEIFSIMRCMKSETIDAWYQLYLSKDALSFYKLMDSLK